MAGYIYNLLEMARNGYKWLEWLDMAGNGWKLLDTVLNEMAFLQFWGFREYGI